MENSSMEKMKMATREIAEGWDSLYCDPGVTIADCHRIRREVLEKYGIVVLEWIEWTKVNGLR